MYNHQLDTFVAVAELGSFSKAAEKLYISPPSVIQQINLLELSLGVTLFTRSNRGVKLTVPGKSIFDDAKIIIQLSREAKEKAAALASAAEKEVRIGTSTLFKCRMLPDLWMKTANVCEGLKIQIIPIPETADADPGGAVLGVHYDIREGVFADTVHEGDCNFLELSRTTLCCGVPKGNPLANKEKISLSDLDGQFIVLPIAGISEGLDALRRQISESEYRIHIIDSLYYAIDTFMLCEVNNYILIAQEAHRDIVTNLKMIPLESDITLPYGLMYAKEPTPAVKRFIQAVKDLK